MNTSEKSERDIFYSRVKQRHRRINPCFMTGKGCVHTDHIDREWEDRTGKNNALNSFMVHPFKPNIEAFFELCLERYLRSHYSHENLVLEIEQADKIRRTGYIVCEKICRRVQSVDFLVVDVSAPNANVFYELGLAYAIEQKIIVIHQEKSEFGKRAAKYFANAGCRAYLYKDLNPIEPKDFPLSNYIWQRVENSTDKSTTEPTILLIAKQYGFLADVDISGNSDSFGTSPSKENEQNIDKLLGPSDIYLGFDTHIKAAIGVAIADIVVGLEKDSRHLIPTPYIKLVKGLQSPDEVKKDANFNEVRQQVDKTFCTIIHTGGKAADPMSYFWLGYCHASGKNVIPVTVINEPNDNIDDLAFDIRALWHMTFIKNNPTQFADELQETLKQMIITNFSEWSRRSFWDKMLDRRGKVSIFTGALHNEPIGRDMIGDWDLRAASELTSFFASHQYRATIESPVYQIEQVTKKRLDGKSVHEKDYRQALEQIIRDKNCIVIASPDVNPLTEILLGKLYEVPSKTWFTNSKDVEKCTGVVVSFKEADFKKSLRKEEETPVDYGDLHGRLFYQQIQPKTSSSDKSRLKRGFKGHGVPNSPLQGEFLSQKDNTGTFTVHAHLVIAKNPFDAPETGHHVIILNGVSGPATFALTHILTGGTSTQFVAYDDNFDSDAKSEAFLQQVNQDLDRIKEDQIRGVQYFVEVVVGPPKEEKSATGKHIFDWRRIINWNRVSATPVYIYYQDTIKND